MASLLTHALVGATLAQSGKSEWRKDPRFWVAVFACSIVPDLDVIGFSMGVHYGDLWGHRGMTHSLLFAAIVATSLAVWLGGRLQGRWTLSLLLFLITASHGVLDALTSGGLGVAFFSPFDLRRYFFPWRPIQVSPIGVGAFFSARGIRVLWSEILWIWLPTSVVAVVIWAVRSSRHARHERTRSPATS